MRALIALLLITSASAQPIDITRENLGSGSPGAKGVEQAVVVNGDIYHAPQYLPGYPTAATLWPRIIEVPCTAKDGKLSCQGYNWSPKYGRGEYLFIRPVIQPEVAPQPPQIIREITIKQVPVLVEVPAKPKGE